MSDRYAGRAKISVTSEDTAGRDGQKGWTRTEDKLVADGWMKERPYPVTIDAGAFVNVASPDIVVGLPERRPGRQCVLQVV
jgi:hypothetical protein